MFAVGLLGETGLAGFDFSFKNILSRLPEAVSAAATGYVTGGAFGAVAGTGTAVFVKPSSKKFFTQILTGAGLGAGAGAVTGAALAVGGYSGDKGLVGNFVGDWLHPPPLTAGPAPSPGAPLAQQNPFPLISGAVRTAGTVATVALPLFAGGATPLRGEVPSYPRPLGAVGGSPYQQEALGGGVSPILLVGALGVTMLIAIISARR